MAARAGPEQDLGRRAEGGEPAGLLAALLQEAACRAGPSRAGLCPPTGTRGTCGRARGRFSRPRYLIRNVAGTGRRVRPCKHLAHLPTKKTSAKMVPTTRPQFSVFKVGVTASASGNCWKHQVRSLPGTAWAVGFFPRGGLAGRGRCPGGSGELLPISASVPCPGFWGI